MEDGLFHLRNSERLVNPQCKMGKSTVNDFNRRGAYR